MSLENAASAWCGWSVPECPFLIAYSREMLDDIRLAVVDAFFSIPHGGAEAGGVLYGRFEPERVIIYEQAPLECEHLTGPTFTLSANDLGRLAAMLAARHPRGLVPVGWWHSHTRSEIHLSEADVAVYNRYFPDARQIALVLKPHSFEPTRAGFFFRDGEGEVCAEASFGEFIVDPVARRRPPAPPAPLRAREAMRAAPVTPPRATGNGAEPVVATPAAVVSAAPSITVPVGLSAPSEAPAPPATAAVAAPALAVAPAALALETGSKPLDVALPGFARVGPARSYQWLKTVLAILAAVGVGAVAFYTRDFWMNATLSWSPTMVLKPEPAPAPAMLLGLHAIDDDGQLWIQWDRAATPLRTATGGTLAIQEGGTTRSIELDAAHLQAGSFTYGRQQERVDVTLTVNLPAGGKLQEITTYLGKVPEHTPGAGSSLQKTNQKLVDDLNAERAHARQLEDALKLQQQRKRLAKQLPDQ
jgi:proteasome lid subunit RPN8/RPN11